MKWPIVVLTIGTFAAFIATAATLVSAVTYGVVATVFALAGSAYLYRIGKRWLALGTLRAFLALYAILDATLRYFAGLRVLDFVG